MRNWYSGYAGPGRKLYNCWTIDSALDYGTLEPHWLETGMSLNVLVGFCS